MVVFCVNTVCLNMCLYETGVRVMWVLGIESRMSERAASTPNH